MPATRPLPDSPDLDQLKRQAKDLLRAARAADPTALSRFRMLPSLQHASDDDLARASLALHDAQSVIAREHGFPSWNALREHVEELTLDFDAAAREFVEAATDGRSSRAERLLALHPRIAGASVLHGARSWATSRRSSRTSRSDRELVHERGGPRDWQPLHYVCHTSLGNSQRRERGRTRRDRATAARARRRREHALSLAASRREPPRALGRDARRRSSSRSPSCC